jgi:hypothetical protein
MSGPPLIETPVENMGLYHFNMTLLHHDFGNVDCLIADAKISGHGGSLDLLAISCGM